MALIVLKLAANTIGRNVLRHVNRPLPNKTKKPYLVQCFQILSYKTCQALILKQSNPYSCAYAGELEETMAELEES